MILESINRPGRLSLTTLLSGLAGRPLPAGHDHPRLHVPPPRLAAERAGRPAVSQGGGGGVQELRRHGRVGDPGTLFNANVVSFTDF